ncbi:MAG: cytochrome c-type biogenesis protein, partial [Streptosporangiaceae bacterium]
PTLDARVQHIAGEVRCPVCEGESAAQSSAPASVQIRDTIRRELQAGQSDSQILTGLVASYGPGILEKPQASGISLVVWVVPVLAVVAAIAGLTWAFARWRAKAAAPAPDDADRALVGQALSPSGRARVGDVGAEGSADADDEEQSGGG